MSAWPAALRSWLALIRLIYLFMVWVSGWLVLLARSDAVKDAEIPLLVARDLAAACGAHGLVGEPLITAGSCPAWSRPVMSLIGPRRWTSLVDCGGAVAVRFPSEDRVNAAYHIDGSYTGTDG